MAAHGHTKQAMQIARPRVETAAGGGWTKLTLIHPPTKMHKRGYKLVCYVKGNRLVHRTDRYHFGDDERWKVGEMIKGSDPMDRQMVDGSESYHSSLKSAQHASAKVETARPKRPRKKPGAVKRRKTPAGPTKKEPKPKKPDLESKQPEKDKPYTGKSGKQRPKPTGNGPGYSRVEPSPAHGRIIQKWAQRTCGLSDVYSRRNMHVTLISDKRNKAFDVESRRGAVYNAMPYTVAMLGDDRSLVILLKSPELEARHRTLVDAGYDHGYPGYKPHLSLKQNATDEDFLKAINCLPQLVKQLPKLTLYRERWEKTKAGWGASKSSKSAIASATARYDPEMQEALGLGYGGDFSKTGEPGTLRYFVSLMSTLQRFTNRIFWDLPKLQRTADGDVDERLSARVYTTNNVYNFSARINKDDPYDHYLGCIARSRKLRIEEGSYGRGINIPAWTHGQDLADGPLNLDTWVRILSDIVSMEAADAARELGPNWENDLSINARRGFVVAPDATTLASEDKEPSYMDKVTGALAKLMGAEAVEVASIQQDAERAMRKLIDKRETRGLTEREQIRLSMLQSFSSGDVGHWRSNPDGDILNAMEVDNRYRKYVKYHAIVKKSKGSWVATLNPRRDVEREGDFSKAFPKRVEAKRWAWGRAMGLVETAGIATVQAEVAARARVAFSKVKAGEIAVKVNGKLAGYLFKYPSGRGDNYWSFSEVTEAGKRYGLDDDGFVITSDKFLATVKSQVVHVVTESAAAAPKGLLQPPVELSMLDKPYPYNPNPDHTKAIFKTEDGRTIKMKMDMVAADLNGEEATIGEIIFTDERQLANRRIVKLVTLTNEGDAFRIFATVLDFVRKAAKRLKLDGIMFSAKEKNRIRLYKLLMRRYSGDLLTTFHEYPNETMFFMSKDRDLLMSMREELI